jgi:ATP-binding cassette subfamily F protein uup
VLVAKPVEASKPIEKQGKKLSFKEKQEFENIEKDIAKLEAEKVTIADKMSDDKLAFEEIKKLSDRLITIDNELGMKEFRWLELSEGI